MPQLLHELGYCDRGQVWVSVPKRILAVELAARVAEEMGTRLGELVGYEIRGERRISRTTGIVFMTEGMLRAKIRSNPELAGVSVILFDEFHQRTLMSDFNVALVERAQDAGWDGAFLLMSATIDPARLADHFGCGVVDGSALGTQFPVAEIYQDPTEAGEDWVEGAAEAVAQLATTGVGNGLVFCPGKADINAVIAAIQRRHLPDFVTVLPLHGDLDGAERHSPFVERSGVTVTVATDIVETGATLPNIGWVVDSGLAKEVGYDPIADISSLKSRRVAQDRLGQRRGRAGRERNGLYVGLFSEEDALARPERTEPEIFRKPLREVVLTIKSLGLSREGKPLRLIDNPPKANWQQAKRQLQQLDLVAEDTEAAITPRGEQAVELGCDPREAVMLLKAAELGCLREMAVAIAASQSKPLFHRVSLEEQGQATAKRARFQTSKACDAWKVVEITRAAEGRENGSLGSFCREHFISYRALTEVFTTSRQLLDGMKRFGYRAGDEPGTEAALRQAIAAGLPDRRYRHDSRDRFYAVDERGYTSYSDMVVLGRESVVERSGDIVAWEIIEIPTRRGSMRLVTNACRIENS